MQSAKEQQEEIKKPSSVINKKKQRETIEWENQRSLPEMGSIKDRNGMDLTEAEDIKKWQEYTEELYKKRSLQPR